jgi:hypothetical protein
MKILLAIVLITITLNLFGQDGSDIMYWKANAVNNTLIGRHVHFDFYRRSFSGREVDTMVIYIDKRPIQFVEVRKDTGYNNWFNEQHLISVSPVENQRIRISKCKLENVTKDSIAAVLYLDYRDLSDSKLTTSRQLQYVFDKKIINEVLVESK